MLLAHLKDALNQVERNFRNFPPLCLLGGSCGLILQGIELDRAPRDIDLYTDEQHVEVIVNAFSDYITEPTHFSETDIYRSILTRFHLLETPIELVGGFRVSAKQCSYQVEIEVLLPFAEHYGDEAGSTFSMMPLAHELLFNLLRGRADRYEPILCKINEEPGKHLPLLQLLIRRNSFSDEARRFLTDRIQGLSSEDVEGMKGG